MPSFAEQLSAARKAAGLTPEQLADTVHVARNTISSWERGRTQPDLNTLRTLGQILHFDFMNGNSLPQEEENTKAETEKPAGTAHAETSPAEAAPGEARPAETAPTENAIPEAEPAGSSSETGPAGAASGEVRPAGAAPVKTPFSKRNIILAVAAFAAIVLIVCLLVIPKSSNKPTEYTDGSGKIYTAADYQAVTPNEAGKAYLSITTTLERQPTSNGGQFMYTFTMKEENGIGFTIERMEHINFFYSTNTISMDTFTADDVRSWGDDPEIKPYGVYRMDCGINAKTPSGTPNAIGAAFQVWGTDAGGHPLTFTAYIPLPLE